MAEIEVSKLSLIELANRTQNNTIVTVSEVLSKTNDVLMDAVWVEANKITSHVHTRRASLPTGTWRLANQGASEEASRTVTIEEGIGVLESFSTIDELLIELANDKKKFISTEDLAFVEGLGQTFNTALIYGNTATAPETFNGLATRLNSLGDRVVSCGGSGSDLTSLYIVQWGENEVHMVYKPNLDRPQLSHPVTVQDLGYETVTDSSSNPYRAHRTQFRISAGLAVHDDRNYGRLCNIETSGTSNIFDPDKLIEILNHMKNRGKGAKIYGNQTMLTQLDIKALSQDNHWFTVATLFGVEITTFRGHPVRLQEAILDTESAVS